MAKNYLENITNTIYAAPLWIQEVIFIDMKKNLEIKYPGLTSPPNEDEVYPAFVPQITFKGKKELESHEHNFDENIYKFLKSTTENIRILDITLNNFWTLEQTSEAFIFCAKNELVKEPENIIIWALALYLGNDIRLGEYVKKINKININELDEILRKQKTINTANPAQPKRIGEILIDFGFVAQNDINKIIHIKEEAKKRFLIPNSALLQNPQTNQTDINAQLQKLTDENKLLKDKLRAIFNIQNQTKQ